MLRSHGLRFFSIGLDLCGPVLPFFSSFFTYDCGSKSLENFFLSDMVASNQILKLIETCLLSICLLKMLELSLPVFYGSELGSRTRWDKTWKRYGLIFGFHQ
jgi:hypothetical protein